MNWLKAIKQLLGRFWADLFADSDFLLGVEYLLSLYSKLTQNQYLNWRNGMIAANKDVEQSNMPYIVLLEIPKNDPDEIEREWYGWDKLWDSKSAKKFVDNTYYGDDDSKYGWILHSKENIDCPDYLIDHMYGYKKILLRGLDYDFYDGRFIFYADPKELDIPLTKITDGEGALHVYYKFFGVSFQTQKICDPVTGFESQWLNPCSEIAWDIHQNGATYYNTKQLLGKATGAVICESDGIVSQAWMEQDYHCLSVNGKAYMSKQEANVEGGDEVVAGTVLFGDLAVYKGTDDVTAEQVPGIKVMTDAGQLTALNETVIPPKVSGMYMLPLVGDPVTVHKYKDICRANMENDRCPYIQVGDYDIETGNILVNPYKFITQKLRRGRAVTVRLVAASLDYLAAAIRCIRKSSCASGIVNIYVATETESDEDNPYTGAMVKLLTVDPDASIEVSAGESFYDPVTQLIYTAYNHRKSDGTIEVLLNDGVQPSDSAIYLDLSTDTCYRWLNNAMTEVSKETGAAYSTLTTSVFSADAGMLAIAAVETLTIQAECAEAKVVL